MFVEYGILVIFLAMGRIPFLAQDGSVRQSNITTTLDIISDRIDESLEMDKEVTSGVFARRDSEAMAPLLKGWNASIHGV